MKKSILSICIVLAFSAGAQAAGDAEAGKAKSAVCAACHGVDGNSMVPTFPTLAGQHQAYLAAQIKAFKNEERKDPSMAPIVAALSDEDINDLSAYFSSQTTAEGKPGEYDRLLGMKLYNGGNKDSNVPACMACHGPQGKGNPGAGYPALKGQQPMYTEKQLKDYRSGARGATPAAQQMRDVAARLSDDEIKALAGFVAGLGKAAK